MLLAEDDETNQLYATSLLEREGWLVDVAKNGREAIALAGAGAYDAILMDCQMPEIDGFDATRQIRRLEGGAHTPIVALTAHEGKSERERCLAAGMDAHVVKPFDLAILEEALERAISRDLQPHADTAQPPDGPASETVAVLDRSRLASLSPALGEQLTELFIRGSRERIAALVAAQAAGDVLAARGLAHTLKGAAATIGATWMSVACAHLGEAFASGQADDIAARQFDLETAFASTEAVL
jgi:CheY-like chemotaxis protein/HPt (histidine-containing phosphotransfer) domain-containing protein